MSGSHKTHPSIQIQSNSIEMAAHSNTHTHTHRIRSDRIGIGSDRSDWNWNLIWIGSVRLELDRIGLELDQIESNPIQLLVKQPKKVLPATNCVDHPIHQLYMFVAICLVGCPEMSHCG